VTAWLRVPLDWYHSSTFAHFPDETHAAIKRSFNTPAPNPSLPPTRRQFCGYCGTHLTAWNEGLHGHDQSADFVNVTLGSLLNESLERLESLRLYGDLDSESESGLVKDDNAQIDNDTHIPTTDVSDSGLVKDQNAQIDDDTHIPTNEESAGGVDAPTLRTVAHSMQGRGMPYFEEMVENSRLGRIKRQMGGHTSADGTRTVQWEVVEIGGEDEPMAEAVAASGNGNKRLRMGA
jgi:hypothetical protein